MCKTVQGCLSFLWFNSERRTALNGVGIGAESEGLVLA